MLKISIACAKAINFVINLFKLGAGLTWPGELVLKLFPNIFSKLNFDYPNGIVLISGTNGKTTTSKLISAIFKESGHTVVTNSSGANLVNGVLTSVLMDHSLNGVPHSDIAVFEVDEFALPFVLNVFTPRCLVLTNLSRDQLDRYGEVDIIVEKWKSCLAALPDNIALFYDATNEYLVDVASSFSGVSTTFSQQTSTYTSVFDVVNAKNITAAKQVTSFLGVSSDTVSSALDKFEAAYGRGEKIDYSNASFQVLLAKNPASFNHNLNSLLQLDSYSNVLVFILNDEIPDGRDVSWIYDIDPEVLYNVCASKTIFVGGSRAFDMAVRLKYARVFVPENNIFFDFKLLLDNVAQRCARDDSTALVLPNYSAMLKTREILLGRRIL